MMKKLIAVAVLVGAFAVPVLAQEGCNPATDPSCPGFVAPTTTTVPSVCYSDEPSCEHGVPPTTTTTTTTTMPVPSCNPLTDPSCPGFVSAGPGIAPSDPTVQSAAPVLWDASSVSRAAYGVHPL